MSLKRDGVEHCNTGSWTQENATYVAIDHQGVCVLEYRDPPEESLEQEMQEELEMDFEDPLPD